MDLVVSSPRTAERRISIIADTLPRKITQEAEERIRVLVIERTRYRALDIYSLRSKKMQFSPPEESNNFRYDEF